MIFWIVISLLTVVAAVALLLPLLRGDCPSDLDPATPDLAGEAAVYRDQLQELDRDKAQGLISADEADYARAEIARRLLSVSGKAPGEALVGKGPIRRHPLAQVFIIILLPAIGLGLYPLTGSPGLPDQPLAARLENPGTNMDLLVAKAERHLAENPADGRGWDILAPIYFKAGRLGDAELAYRNGLRLNGVSPERLAGLAETLIAAADGVVTADARSALEEAQRLGGANPRIAFYLALAIEQDGRKPEALAAFQALASQSPAGAPWLPLLRDHIVRNGGQPLAEPAKAPGGPTEEEIAASAAMAPADRLAMVRGMVESLDAKLKQDPDNFEGWMRLVRSYAMLQQPDQAVAALKAGLAAFPADQGQGQQLIAAARALNLPVDEALR